MIFAMDLASAHRQSYRDSELALQRSLSGGDRLKQKCHFHVQRERRHLPELHEAWAQGSNYGSDPPWH